MKFKVKFRIQQHSGEKQKFSFNLEENQRFFLGSETSSLRMTDPKMAGRHCYIVIKDRILYVKDYESESGILVNNEKQNRATLKPGDVLSLGDTLIEVLEAPYQKPDEQAATRFIDIGDANKSEDPIPEPTPAFTPSKTEENPLFIPSESPLENPLEDNNYQEPDEPSFSTGEFPRTASPYPSENEPSLEDYGSQYSYHAPEPPTDLKTSFVKKVRSESEKSITTQPKSELKDLIKNKIGVSKKIKKPNLDQDLIFSLGITIAPAICISALLQYSGGEHSPSFFVSLFFIIFSIPTLAALLHFSRDFTESVGSFREYLRFFAVAQIPFLPIIYLLKTNPYIALAGAAVVTFFTFMRFVTKFGPLVERMIIVLVLVIGSLAGGLYANGVRDFAFLKILPQQLEEKEKIKESFDTLVKKALDKEADTEKKKTPEKTLAKKTPEQKRETSKNSYSEFLVAARTGNLEKIKRLVKAGIDVDTKSESGSTALMAASYYGHFDIVRFLIRNKANLNIQEVNGNTALMWASSKGHKYIVQILLENKAKVYLKNKDGLSALAIAKRIGHKEILSLLDTKSSKRVKRVPASKKKYKRKTTRSKRR